MKLLKILLTKKPKATMPMCPCCEKRTLAICGNDSFADFGMSEDGMVSYYTCLNCGCEVEVWKSFEEEGGGGD